jgi:hypothetical protein
MAALAFLLATIQLALVGFGVTVVGSSELHNLAFGLALVALGLVLGALPTPAVTVSRRG